MTVNTKYQQMGKNLPFLATFYMTGLLQVPFFENLMKRKQVIAQNNMWITETYSGGWGLLGLSPPWTSEIY